MRREYPLCSFTLLLIAQFALCERPAAVSGPALGFVFDPAQKALKPILGLPGAATIGPALELNVDLTDAAIAPQHDFALVAGGGEVALLRIGPAGAAIRPLPGVAAADRIAFSSAGEAAVLYYAGRASIRILTSLRGEPAAGPEIDISGLPGALVSVAVNEDGRVVLAGVSDGQSGSVLLLSPERGARHILSLGVPSSITFLHGRPDALVADRAGNQLYLVRDVTAGAEVQTLAAERDGLSAPIAVQVSGDDTRVFVANAGTGTILALDPAVGAAAAVPCHCALSGLDRLAGNAVFRLTDPSHRPLWLFDGDAPEPRIVFVPEEKAPPEALYRGRRGRR